jgi:hypothetical protein
MSKPVSIFIVMSVSRFASGPLIEGLPSGFRPALVFFLIKSYQTSVSAPLVLPHLLISENLGHIYWNYYILIRKGAGDAR